MNEDKIEKIEAIKNKIKIIDSMIFKTYELEVRIKKITDYYDNMIKKIEEYEYRKFMS